MKKRVKYKHSSWMVGCSSLAISSPWSERNIQVASRQSSAPTPWTALYFTS